MSADFSPPGSCGSCVMCCEWLDIKTEEFSKDAGTLCRHCTGGGCGIYETRPQVCRGFFCGWRLIPALGPDWRPDKSGVIIQIVEKFPAEYSGAATGFNFNVVGGEAAILRPGFAEYLNLLVSRQVAVYLSADSPKTLMNEYLRELAGNLPGATKMLLHIHGLHLEARRLGLVGRSA